MRALLINPWIYDFSAYDLWSRPLGLLLIAAYLKRCAVEIEFIDCLDRNHPALKYFLKNKLPRSSSFGCGNYFTEKIEKPPLYKQIPRYYKRYGIPKNLFIDLLKNTNTPDIILVTSGMTYWYPAVFDIIAILKERFKKSIVLLGGIYARLCPEHAKRYSQADVVCTSKSIPEVIKLIFQLTNYNFDYQELTKRKFFYAYELYPHLEAVTLRTCEGCPFRCSYCGWYLLEREFSFVFSPDFVIKTIEYYNKVRGIINFAFYDDALLYQSEKHAIKIMQGILKNKIKANFHTPNGLNIRFLTSEVARLLKKSGFLYPRLGLEKIYSEITPKEEVKANKKDFLKAVRYLIQAGYRPQDIGVNIMMGLPNQNLDQVEEDVKFLTEQRLRIHLEEYSCVPGTVDFDATGLGKDADPLLHNKNALCLRLNQDITKIQNLKDLVHQYNASLRS